MKRQRSHKPTQGRATLAGLLFVLLVALGTAASSHAHFAVSRKSLRALVAESDLVVHAKVIQAERLEPIEGAKGWKRRPASIRVLGVIKGPASQGERFQFAQHGHGSAELGPGQQALVFLRDISRSRELAPLETTGELRWYSKQEHIDDWLLAPDSRKAILASAHRYAAIEEMLRGARDAALHKITVALLMSSNSRLAKSALQDLRILRDAPLVTSDDLPKLTAVVEDEGRAIEIRVGLLMELERRGLLDGESIWVRLLNSTRGPERLAVIPAAGARLTPAIRAQLEAILRGDDAGAASAAAVALGAPGNDAAVPALNSALQSNDARLAISAIRGLGRIGTAEARAALESAAAAHPDPDVRRRARAELDKLSR